MSAQTSPEKGFKVKLGIEVEPEVQITSTPRSAQTATEKRIQEIQGQVMY